MTSLTCGKTRGGAEGEAKHSQGATINCLSQKIDSVSDKCKKEIFTIAEFQADDFHLDRALYLACAQDKDQFCGRVQAGEGRVYRKGEYFFNANPSLVIWSSHSVRLIDRKVDKYVCYSK